MDPSDNAVVDPGSLGAAMTEQRGPTPAREPPGGEGVSIVVPTYREAGNLRPLAARVSAVMRKARVPWELVLVDDASGDGSEAIAAELGRALPVRMVVRRAARPDLSLSVLAGFRAARFDRLVVMDADLSHPAESIPALLATAQPGTLAIGSRYAAGGSVDAVWSRWRRLNSRVATLLARPLAAGSDPLAGFFAVERASLPELDRLRPVGFKIALEIAVRGRLAVHDVPIAFRDRQRGASKMGWRAQADFVPHLHRLYLARFGHAARLASFGAVGASGFALDVAGYLGLQNLGEVHRRQGRIDAAEAAYRKAPALDPDLPVAASLHVFSGHSLGALGRPAAADEHYGRALAVDPRNGSALDRLAMSRFGAGRYAEALTLYRTLAEVNPGSATTRANLGATLYYLGRHAEAFVEVERALAIDPDHAPAQAGLAEVRKALGRDR